MGFYNNNMNNYLNEYINNSRYSTSFDKIYRGNIFDSNGRKNIEVFYYPVICENNIVGIEISTGSIFPLFKPDLDLGYKGSTARFFEEVEYYLPLPYNFDFPKNGKALKNISVDPNYSFMIVSNTEVNKYLSNISKTTKKFICFLAEKNCSVFDLKNLKKEIVDQYVVSSSVDGFLKRVLQDALVYPSETSILEKENEELKKQLDDFNVGYDLSERNDLTNVVGREREINKLIKSCFILNESVILIGEAGVGKTSIVEGLVSAMNKIDNFYVNDKILYVINAASLVSGTKYRGEFEERLEKIFKLCANNRGRIVLFIDEIHMLFGLGNGDDSKNVCLNILKPYVEKGDVIIIGATTPKEYSETIARDKAFISRCNIVKVGNLTNENNIEIICQFIKETSKLYNVDFELDENKICILSEELLNICKHQNVLDRILPIRLAKRIIKDAVATSLLQSRNVVTIDDIINSIKESTEIIIHDEREMEYNMRKKLNISTQNSKILVLGGRSCN